MPRVERFVEAGARAAHHQVGFAGEVPRGELELVDRARVDEVHRDAERNAERDGEHRERSAARDARATVPGRARCTERGRFS